MRVIGKQTDVDVNDDQASYRIGGSGLVQSNRYVEAVVPSGIISLTKSILTFEQAQAVLAHIAQNRRQGEQECIIE